MDLLFNLVDIKKIYEAFNIAQYIVFVVSVLFVGIVLILVNIIVHSFIENRKLKSSREEIVRRNIEPVKRAAIKLISRISDMLISHTNELQEHIKKYKNITDFEDYAKKIKPGDMNRLESTAYRLIDFLVLIEFFRRQTADVPLFHFLGKANFYLQNKIPTGLRGNLYGKKMISTEMQESMATCFLENYPNAKAADLSITKFCSLLKEDKYPIELYKKAIEVFCVDTTLLEKNINRDDPAWKHILNIAHFTVYLIDFFQDYGNNSCAEQRFIFARLIKQWNQDATIHRYLYDDRDVNTNYIDSFPSTIGGFWPNLDIPEIISIRKRVRRIGKSILLRVRGSRFQRGHAIKRIKADCLKVKMGSDWKTFKWDEGFSVLYDGIKEHIKRTHIS